MAKIKNISPLGDLEVPSFGLVVRAGETVEVSEEIAASLLAQTDNWTAADKAAVSLQAPATTAAEKL
jgi:hypothetical protein